MHTERGHPGEKSARDTTVWWPRQNIEDRGSAAMEILRWIGLTAVDWSYDGGLGTKTTGDRARKINSTTGKTTYHST